MYDEEEGDTGEYSAPSPETLIRNREAEAARLKKLQREAKLATIREAIPSVLQKQNENGWIDGKNVSYFDGRVVKTGWRRKERACSEIAAVRIHGDLFLTKLGTFVEGYNIVDIESLKDAALDPVVWAFEQLVDSQD